MAVKFKETIFINTLSSNNRQYTKSNFENIKLPVIIGFENDIEYDGILPNHIIGEVTNIEVNDNYIVLYGFFNNEYIIQDNYTCMPSGVGNIDYVTKEILDYTLHYFNYTCVPAMKYQMEFI